MTSCRISDDPYKRRRLRDSTSRRVQPKSLHRPPLLEHRGSRGFFLSDECSRFCCHPLYFPTEVSARQPDVCFFAARKSNLAPLAGRGYLSSGALELERHINLGAIGLYFSLGVQLHIEFDDLCDAEFSERFCGSLDRVGGGLFPGFVAGTDQFNDLVDALRHFVLPFGMKQVLPAAVQPSTTISALKGRCLIAGWTKPSRIPRFYEKPPAMSAAAAAPSSSASARSWMI